MTTPLDQWKIAVERGDTAAVRALFAAHPELSDHVDDQIFAFDSSAIFLSRRNIEMVNLLLEHGADINQKTGWGAGGFGILEGVTHEVGRPLIARGAIVDIWAAVGLNDIERTRDLLDHDASLVSAPGGDGKRPLHYAQDVEMVDLLLSRGAEVNARCVDHGSTPLQYSIQNRNVVFRLLDHGAEPDIFMAAYWGSIEHAKRCIAADPECCHARLGDGEWSNLGKGDIYKWTIEHDATPLQVARSRDNGKAFDFMWQHASPVAKLTDAIWQGDRNAVDGIRAEHEDALSELIANDPDAMTRAVWWHYPKAVKLMLDLGFNPHQTGVHDSSPLDRAAFHGFADIIELLLQHDPNPPIHGTNEFGATPLMACIYGLNHGWDTGHPQDHVRTAELLIEAGSEVNERLLGMGNAATKQLISDRLAKE